MKNVSDKLERNGHNIPPSLRPTEMISERRPGFPFSSIVGSGQFREFFRGNNRNLTDSPQNRVLAQSALSLESLRDRFLALQLVAVDHEEGGRLVGLPLAEGPFRHLDHGEGLAADPDVPDEAAGAFRLQDVPDD